MSVSIAPNTKTSTAVGDRGSDHGCYRVATGLHFPTSLGFDDAGRLHVAESGLPLGSAPAGGRVLRVEDAGRTRVVCDGLRQPVNGLTYFDGAWIVSEGGSPGRISRVEPGGRRTTILDDLPGDGNYHTNMVAVGPDRKLYFSQGALTNLGIVGLDAYELAWLGKLPQAHDVPGFDVVLSDVVVESPDPLADAPHAVATTGAFAPFGHSHPAGQRLPGRVPCTASVMRCNADGSGLELVAWGVRNAYGLLFLPDGRLLATDQGSDDRGSRPVGNVPDLLFEVRAGAWYGWPDFVAGRPVSKPEFAPTRPEARQRLDEQRLDQQRLNEGHRLRPLLANHHELPPPEPALLEFPVNAAATKMAQIPGDMPGVGGHLLVCLFGDERPMTGPLPDAEQPDGEQPGAGPRRIGRSLARVDPTDWSLHPAFPPETAPSLHRPIDVAFGPDGDVWIVDFGRFEMTDTGADSEPGTGAVIRVDGRRLAS